MQDLPSTRKEAKLKKSKFYFTGKPCHNGGIAKRLTSVGRCYCDSCVRDVRASRIRTRNKKADYYNKKRSEHKRKNKDKVNAYFRDYKRKNRVSFNLRSFISYSMKRLKQGKLKSSLRLVDYSVDEFKNHIESNFKDGMSWDNYGEWHIDHIKPIKAFMEEGVTDPSIVNALGNIQPLWASDNFKKSASYSDD